MTGAELQKELIALRNAVNDEEEFTKVWNSISDITKHVLREVAKEAENHDKKEDLRKLNLKLNLRLFDIQNSAFDTIYKTTRQGTATNTLTKLRGVENRGLTIDDVNGTATIKKGEFALTIPHYKQLTGLKTSTHQLLDLLTIELTAKSPTVILPLKEYVRVRGLKDIKTAREQVKADLDVLRTTSLTWEERKGKKTEKYSFINLADSGEIRNGNIVFTFGSTFYNLFLGYPVMPYPAQLQKLNSKKNPNSYYLLRKIAEHKNMNIGKKNEDIIAVKTLLNSAPYLPTYNEVMSADGDRHTEQRIIEPFERDLDALNDVLTWSYCHKVNEPLTDEELATMNYSAFENLLIHFELKNYPERTAKIDKGANVSDKKKRAKKSTTGKTTTE